ncbi:MAG: signal peptidase I [Bacteroidetes bacterium GWA2_40_14]|jgi:signal peptidase I|nr:MAG: signal peptidase I [Bacteroidetes bacterium GWA2_40_14]
MATKEKKKKGNSKNSKWIKLAIGVLLFLLVVKGLVLESVVVTDRKMEKTLFPGDLLIVNKLSYGARLPITLLSVPFFPNYYLEWVTLPVSRLPGFSKPEPNDLVAFNYPGQLDPPIDKKKIMIKRLVAQPGDSVLIRDKKIFINGIPFNGPATLQYNYRLTASQKKIDQGFLDLYDIHEGGMVSEHGLYDFPMTRNVAEEIAQDTDIKNLRVLKDFPGENVKYVFPVGYFHHFNKDFFGPLVVPYPGMQVYLDTHSIELYAEIIDFYEGNDLQVKDYKIFINGTETTNYTIKNDYYFVMDDNRDNAKDSRYWGFLPEDYILGKAVMVGFSWDNIKREVRWNRIFNTF